MKETSDNNRYKIKHTIASLEALAEEEKRQKEEEKQRLDKYLQEKSSEIGQFVGLSHEEVEKLQREVVEHVKIGNVKAEDYYKLFSDSESTSTQAAIDFIRTLAKLIKVQDEEKKNINITLFDPVEEPTLKKSSKVVCRRLPVNYRSAADELKAKSLISDLQEFKDMRVYDNWFLKRTENMSQEYWLLGLDGVVGSIFMKKVSDHLFSLEKYSLAEKPEEFIAIERDSCFVIHDDKVESVISSDSNFLELLNKIHGQEQKNHLVDRVDGFRVSKIHFMESKLYSEMKDRFDTSKHSLSLCHFLRRFPKSFPECDISSISDIYFQYSGETQQTHLIIQEENNDLTYFKIDEDFFDAISYITIDRYSIDKIVPMITSYITSANINNNYIKRSKLDEVDITQNF